MISLADAAQNGFHSSTNQELITYAEEAGIKLHHRMKPDTIRRALLEHLGLAAMFQGSDVPEPKRPTANTKHQELFPPYNLTPNGIWGGRRHRIVLRRPDGVKLEAGILPSWNGKAPYPVKYDQVENVPEPILNRLRELDKPRAMPHKLPNGDMTTVWEFDPRHHIDYRGVDPETKDRCGSLNEWFVAKGPGWFRKLNVRQMSQIALAVDVTWMDRDRKVLPIDDLMANLLRFFFGYSDAEDADGPMPQSIDQQLAAAGVPA